MVDGENGDDAALRPNQVFAISLDHPVLDQAHWKPVMEQVTDHLLTPFGLRSLAPSHPDYKPTYDGDLRLRDAAYHQGTVWAWLIGPYIDAWLRVYPYDAENAHKLLSAFDEHLNEACLGSISEIFDAEAAVPAARLHCAGVERGGSAARVDENADGCQEQLGRARRPA